MAALAGLAPDGLTPSDKVSDCRLAQKSPAETGLGGRRTEIGHREFALESVPHAPLMNNQKLESWHR